MTTPECWRPVPVYEGLYEVSDLGNVRRIRPSHHKRSGILKLYPTDGGYLRMQLCKESIRKYYFVHCMVARAFLGPPTAPEVNHIDGDKKNNRPDNLEYVTRIANIQHSWAIGLRKPGSTTPKHPRHGRQHPCAKLTDEHVRHIRSSKESRAKLAARYGVGNGTIQDIKEHKTWKHIA